MSLNCGCHRLQLWVLDGRDESQASGRCACRYSCNFRESAGSEEEDDEEEQGVVAEDEHVDNEQRGLDCTVGKPEDMRRPDRKSREHHRGDARTHNPFRSWCPPCVGCGR